MIVLAGRMERKKAHQPSSPVMDPVRVVDHSDTPKAAPGRSALPLAGGIQAPHLTRSQPPLVRTGPGLTVREKFNNHRSIKSRLFGKRIPPLSSPMDRSPKAEKTAKEALRIYAMKKSDQSQNYGLNKQIKAAPGPNRIPS